MNYEGEKRENDTTGCVPTIVSVFLQNVGVKAVHSPNIFFGTPAIY